MSDFSKLGDYTEIPISSTSTLKLGRATNRVKQKYENWLELRARQRVFDLRSDLGEEAFQESMRATTDACAAGSLSWGGEAWRASLRQLPGVVKMACLLSEQAGDKMDESKLLELTGDIPVWELVLTAVREALDASPNFLAPPTRGANN